MDVVGLFLTVLASGWLIVRWGVLVRSDQRVRLLAPGLVLALGLALFAIAYVDHLTFIAWMQEDRPVEWATVLAFAAAAALCFWQAVASKEQRWLALGWLAAAATWFFVAGEEFSWGQRVLGYATPEALLATNTQLEANLHNTLTDSQVGPVPLDPAFLTGLVGFLLGGPGAWLTRLLRDRRGVDWTPLFARGPLGPLLLVVAGLQWWHPVDYGSETTELLLGLCALLVAWPERNPRAASRASLAQLGAVLATLLLGSALSPLLAPRDEDPQKLELARREIVALAGDMHRGFTPLANAILQLRHETFHARVQWTLQRLDVDLPGDSDFLGGHLPAHRGGPGGRTGYFLDPWHSPLWLYLDFKGRRLMIYSFGPNRRRDTAVHRDELPQGDDVGVNLRWPEGAATFTVPTGEKDDVRP